MAIQLVKLVYNR